MNPNLRNPSKVVGELYVFIREYPVSGNNRAEISTYYLKCLLLSNILTESQPITSPLFIHFVGASRCPPTSAAGAGHALPGSSLLLPPLLPRCPGHCCQDRRESRVVPNTGAEQQPPGSFRAQTRILLADSSPCNDGDTFEQRSSATR